jgi:hypothetical protein
MSGRQAALREVPKRGLERVCGVLRLADEPMIRVSGHPGQAGAAANRRQSVLPRQRTGDAEMGAESQGRCHHDVSGGRAGQR